LASFFERVVKDPESMNLKNSNKQRFGNKTQKLPKLMEFGIGQRYSIPKVASWNCKWLIV